MGIIKDANNVTKEFMGLIKKLHIDKLFISMGKSIGNGIKGSLKKKYEKTNSTYGDLCDWLRKELRK